MSKEIKEWFKVTEIADTLGFSKVTVYNKIKGFKEETLQPLRKTLKGITYYNYKIIDLLKDKIQPEGIDQEETATEEIENHNKKGYEDEYIQDLKADINFLRQQVQELNNRLATEQELTKNMQVLQLKQQAPDIKMLEAHQAEFDIKLSEIKQNMQQKKEKQEKKGLYERIFKR